MTSERSRARLAWYANGTLSEREREEVESDLAQATPAERAEVEGELGELKALHAALSEVGDEEPRFKPTLIHDALRQIDQVERERLARAAARPTARLAAWLDRNLASVWREATGIGRFALAAQLGLVLALGSMQLLDAPAVRAPDAPGTGYEVLSESPAPPRREVSRIRVQVMFRPDARQDDIATLLRELGAEIVAGPSAQRLYTIERELDSSAPARPEDAATEPAQERILDAAQLVRVLEASPVVRGVVAPGP